MNFYKNNIKLSIIGLSHSKKIALTLTGVSKEFKINDEKIKYNLSLRRGIDKISTLRRDLDRYEIKQENSKLRIIVYNDDYKNEPFTGVVRPGHADFVQYMKDVMSGKKKL